jgi:hypothetical protein
MFDGVLLTAETHESERGKHRESGCDDQQRDVPIH